MSFKSRQTRELRKIVGCMIIIIKKQDKLAFIEGVII